MTSSVYVRITSVPILIIIILSWKFLRK